MTKRDNQLADPIGALVPRGQQPLTKAQAKILADFFSSAMVARVLQEKRYTSESKLRALIDIAQDATATPTDRMRAIKMLDAIIERACATQAIPFGPDAVSVFPATPADVKIEAVRAVFRKHKHKQPIIEAETIGDNDNDDDEPTAQSKEAAENPTAIPAEDPDAPAPGSQIAFDTDDADAGFHRPPEGPLPA